MDYWYTVGCVCICYMFYLCFFWCAADWWGPCCWHGWGVWKFQAEISESLQQCWRYLVVIWARSLWQQLICTYHFVLSCVIHIDVIKVSIESSDIFSYSFLPTMLCISAAYAVMQCLSVCVSVKFVDHVKTNKHIFKIFSPSGRHTILVFPYQMGWRYSDENPLTGVSNAGGVGRNPDAEPIPGFSACCLCCNKPGVVNRVAGGARPAYR